MMTSSAEIIVFHGRFQPYHIGHHWVIKYLIENTTDPIIIGIINPDPWEIWQSDEPNFIRFAPSRNPLTYWDRYTCITRSISGLSCPERILGIVPLPRPSINFEKCKRFLPSKTLRFVLSLRYGDETERWKKEKYKSLGLELFIIVEEQIPEGIVPISGTMVRDLMATRDDTWKELVPEATIDYLGQTEVLNRVEQVIKSTDALDRIREFANKAPYSGWCQHFLSGYIEQEKSKMVEKKHKYDIIGAIAESLFSLFPVFKGLLRLRDDERRAKQEKAVLKAIREQGQNTVSEVEKILTKYEWNCDSLKSELFRQVYAESLLSVAKCKPNKHKASVLELKTGKGGFNKWRSSLAEDVYLESLIKLYSTNLDDLWILVEDYGFDPSYVKGKTTRAQLRSFMQTLGTLKTKTIVSVLGAIHKEHPGITVFKNVYVLAKQLVD